jgi:hypothetical protein
MKTLKTGDQVLAHLGDLGQNQIKLETELDTTREDRDHTIRLGFKLGVTAKQMVQAMGDDPRTGKPLVGAARVFQIRDGR